MKLSLKVEYSCRVLAQMALRHGSGELTHIEELAQVEKIPKNYLVQILSELRNGGLIHSRRGKQGGYLLARAPEEITLFDIVQVVDADLLEMRFNATGHSGGRVEGVWREISDSLAAKTREYTLKSFLPPGEGEMYWI